MRALLSARCGARVSVIFAAMSLATCLATGVRAQVDDPPTVRVSYAGLDLSRQSDRALLQSRVDHAVEVVCGKRPITVNPDQTVLWNYCRDQARAGVDRQLAALYGGRAAAGRSADVRSSR